jgi:anti-sigma factor RsiW
MTENPHITQEALISYLYDECEPAARAEVVAHLERCSLCAEDIAALGATREHLAGWTPPDIALGFQISRPQPAAILRPQRWWQRPLPAWAQAAAALLIFGAGLSIGAARALTESSEVTGPLAVTAEQSVAPASPPTSTDNLARDVEQLRAELVSLKNTSSAGSSDPAPRSARALMDQAQALTPTAPRADAALLQQVRSLIEESEERQRSEFTLRAAQLARDFEVQRRADLTRIDRTIGRVHEETGVEVRQQRQAIDNLLRVVATSTPGR